MALHFELVTPERLVRSEDVYTVTVPGSEGEFGVFEHHAPMMTTLRDGMVRVYPSQGSVPTEIVVQGGFCEVNERGLTILAEGVGAA